jgi:DNA-3-methyladenine glycosylase II
MKFELRSQAPYNLTRCAMIFSQFPLDGTDVWIPAREIFPAQYRRLYVVANDPVLAIVRQDPDARLIVDTHPLRRKHHAALQSMVAWQFHLDAPLQGFYRRARMHPFFQPLLKTLRGVKPLRTPTLYEMGVIAITEQQISYPVAVKMRSRLIEALGQNMVFEGTIYRAFPTAQAVAGCRLNDLRGFSFSGHKAEYLLDFSRKVADGSFPLEDLRHRANEEVIAALTSLRGFGRWSAEYFLTRGLGRSDVFAADDLVVRRLVGKYLGPGHRVTAKECQEILGEWGPFKRWAVFYLLCAHRLGLIGNEG